MLAFLILVIFYFINASTCPNISPLGWYDPILGRQLGTPTNNGGFSFSLNKPSFLTCKEMSNLHYYCVQRINMYRAGTLIFSNGEIDPTLGNPPPLLQALDENQCENEITLGDFVKTTTSCEGAHSNAFQCPGFNGFQGQNSCCVRNAGSSYSDLTSTIDTCFQQMWDEGINGGLNSTQTGHWKNMKNSNFIYASCGFAFGNKTSDKSYKTLMEQNFASSYTGSTGTLQPTTLLPTKSPTKNPSKSPTLTAFCGNGLVELGEDCDCGTDCVNDLCCNSLTCKYTNGKTCSKQDGCCDLNTCTTPVPSSFICRPSIGLCDIQETCNGISKTCPLNVYKNMGDVCSSTGTCGCNGECILNQDNQCMNWNGQMLRACSWATGDEQCGGLYCEKDNTGTCYGTINPILATSCGNGKGCYNGKCVPTSSITCPNTNQPTLSPSKTIITKIPTTQNPTSLNPTTTNSPTFPTTLLPSLNPTIKPTKLPTLIPTLLPSKLPTINPTFKPTNNPTISIKPTLLPTKIPSTLTPTNEPISNTPTLNPISSICVPTFPLSLTSKKQCNLKLNTCSSFQFPMKWGNFCNRKSSGGCQCLGYCGYTCKGGCMKDQLCLWDKASKLCLNRFTNLPGIDMQNCGI
jgi:hypothetical protein